MKIKEYEKVLNSFQLGVAEKSTLNDMAFYSQKKAKRIQKKDFILRNKWTLKGNQVQKARRIGDSAYMGSVRDYMFRQEFGGTHKPKTGSKSVPLYSSFATANKKGGLPPKKLPTRRNRMKNIKKVDKPRRKVRKLPLGQIFGIHAAKGDSRLLLHKGILWRRTSKKKHVPIWNFKIRSIRTKKHPSIHKAGKGAMKLGQMFFNKNLKYQLKKYGKR